MSVSPAHTKGHIGPLLIAIAQVAVIAIPVIAATGLAL